MVFTWPWRLPGSTSPHLRCSSRTREPRCHSPGEAAKETSLVTQRGNRGDIGKHGKILENYLKSPLLLVLVGQIWCQFPVVFEVVSHLSCSWSLLRVISIIEGGRCHGTLNPSEFIPAESSLSLQSLALKCHVVLGYVWVLSQEKEKLGCQPRFMNPTVESGYHIGAHYVSLLWRTQPIHLY